MENLLAKRMKKLQTAREHGFKNVWTQNGRIMYWDAVSDRVKLYYNYTITLMALCDA